MRFEDFLKKLSDAGYEKYNISNIEEVETEYLHLDKQELIKEQDMILIPHKTNDHVVYQVFLRDHKKQGNILNLKPGTHDKSTIDEEVKKFNIPSCVVPEKMYKDGFNTKIEYHLHLI